MALHQTKTNNLTQKPQLQVLHLEDRVVPATFVVTNGNDSGSGSLRAAVALADSTSGADSIQFQSGITQINLTTGGLTFTDSSTTTIDAGFNGITINGNNSFTLLTIGNSARVNLNGLALSGGFTNTGGGAVASSGIVSISNSTLTNNKAGGSGGAIINSGTMTINNSTISGNRAIGDGGIFNNSGSLTIINSTIANNFAGTSGGAGIGGLNNASGTVLLQNTLIAKNVTGTAGTAASDVSGAVSSTSSNNLIGAGVGSFSGISNNDANANQVGSSATPIDPKIGALANNGGPTQTQALLTGSPAIDKGSNTNASSFSSDQRGQNPRIINGTVDIGAYEFLNSFSGPLVVDNSGDTEDNNFSAGQLTLREAILLANAGSGGGSITFSTALNGATITLGGTELPTVTGNVSISGPGQGITLNGNNQSRILSITDGKSTFSNVNLSNVTFTGGRETDGGALNISENVSILNCTFTANAASTGTGGAAVINDGTTTVINSTFSGNKAVTYGGAINVRANGNLQVTNSTIVQNLADSGSASVGFSGGISLFSNATVTLFNSIVAGNNRGTPSGNISDDLTSTISSSSANNLIGDAGSSGGLTNGVNGNIVGNAGSGTIPLSTVLNTTLANNGGPTMTHALVANSPAIDKGDKTLAGVTATDQRGLPFVRVSGSNTDIGAYEFQSLNLVVDSTADGIDGNYGSGQMTLREAMTLANANPGADTITFASSLSGQTITLNQAAVGGTSGLPRISDPLTITGPGANLLNITRLTGSGDFRLLYVNSGVNVTLSGFTLTNPTPDSNVSGNTGALYNNGGVVTLQGMAFKGNVSNFNGAAVYNTGSLTISNSTFSSNIAGSSTVNTASLGGALFTIGSNPVTITNSTFSGNTATGSGGAIENAGSPLSLVNSTITLNHSDSDDSGAETGGGIHLGTGSLKLTNTIVAGNLHGSVSTTSDDIRGTVDTTSANNLVGVNTNLAGISNGNQGNIIGTAASPVDPDLSPLAFNGSATQTHAYASNTSLAISAGTTSGAPTTDQRGFVRPASSTLSPDIGAYQLQLVTLKPATLFNGSVGVAFNQALTASFPNQPAGTTYVFSTPDTLPAGLTLDPSGAISGTPTQSGSTTIRVTATSTQTGDFSAPASYTITISATSNTPPSITAIQNQTTATGIAVGPLAFSVNDIETPLNNLVVTAISSNTTLIPNSGIALGGTNGNRTVTLTPASGQTGFTTITLTVTDGGGATATTTFLVLVNGTANPPTITAIQNQTTSTGVAVGPLAFTVGDSVTPVNNLIITATSTNTTLVPVSSIVINGTGANRTVTVTPASGQTGSATITLIVTNAGGSSNSTSFTTTVNSSSVAPPVITAIANQSTTTGVAVGPLAFTVSDPVTPAANLVVTATSTNTTLFPAGSLVLGGSAGSRTLTATPASGQTGTATISLTVTNAGGVSTTTTFTIVVSTTATPKPLLVGYPQYSAGQDSGGGAATLYNPDMSVRFTITPFTGFTGGVRTAVTDFNGDGIADFVVGTGPGIATQVTVYDGANQKVLFTVNPFEASFTGGVYLATGDINGDGTPELVITPDQGGGPRARVFNGKTFAIMADFFGIADPSFRGGARAAIGDINGDGFGDLIVAAGFGGGPRISTYDGSKLTVNGGPNLFGDYFAFEDTLRNGTYVTVGDINGDGKAELIAGAGPGGGPRVSAFDGPSLLNNVQSKVADFFAGDTNSRGGIRVAVKNLDGDTKADLIVGAGISAGSRVTAYAGTTLLGGAPPELYHFDAFNNFTGGVYVG